MGIGTSLDQIRHERQNNQIWSPGTLNPDMNKASLKKVFLRQSGKCELGPSIRWHQGVNVNFMWKRHFGSIIKTSLLFFREAFRNMSGYIYWNAGDLLNTSANESERKKG